MPTGSIPPPEAEAKNSTRRWKQSPWPRDYPKPASGNPGAIHRSKMIVTTPQYAPKADVTSLRGLHGRLESRRSALNVLESAVDRLNLLKTLTFGAQVAEDEGMSLADYFVETDQWSRIFRGDIDVVRGEKGSGKSAIYLLILKHDGVLFDRDVLLVNGENPRGATVFKDLIIAPPASEMEFVVLWKLYILVIVCHELREVDVDGKSIRPVYNALIDAKLLEPELNLSSLLRGAQQFAKRLLKIKEIETGLNFDPMSGLPTGIVGKVSLQEPDYDLRSKGVMSIDGLFRKVEEELAARKLSIWVMLDRLDVAFAESHELEANALRGLFKVYGDMRALEHIGLKVFLRDDIWKRITKGGFREASHITKVEVLNWSNETLLNLILRRMLSNKTLVDEFGIDATAVLGDAKSQEEVFARLFPPQVEQGSQKATTFNWMVTRCADGSGNTAPRELIHLLNSIKDQEIRRLERGGAVAPGDNLFDRSVFKLAVPAVSNTRLQTYVYAEYPSLRGYVEKLEGRKTEQSVESLASVWEVDADQALKIANELVEIGFFEQRGTKAAPAFWVPFLYRDALNMVQGKADVE